MAVTFTYKTDDGFDFRKRSVTEIDIEAAERYLGVALPQEFRQFLIEHDNPTPEPAWLPMEGSKWCGPILAFYSTWQPFGRGGIGRSPCLEHLTQYHRNEHKLPKHYIAIAQMLTHPNTLLLSAGRADFGAVYAWRPCDKRFKHDQTSHVSNSLKAMLGMLSEPPAEVRSQFEQRLRDRGRPSSRPPIDDYEGPEARRWLRRNRNPAALGANHFLSTDAARKFVDELYAMGAVKVLIPENTIQKEDDDGPYADSLVVQLPSNAAVRAALCLRCEEELDLPERFDQDDSNPLYLWWD
jgi:hypothetical protein